MTTWSKTPPTEEGDYYILADGSFRTEPVWFAGKNRKLYWGNNGTLREGVLFGPRIPTPERLAALEECAELLKAIIPEDQPTGGGDFVTVIPHDVGEWAEQRTAALARLEESEEG